MALAAWWKFDGNGLDSQGTAHATSDGTPTFRVRDNNVGWDSNNWGSGNNYHTAYNAALNFGSGGTNTVFTLMFVARRYSTGSFVIETNDLRAPYGDGWRLAPFWGGNGCLFTLSQGYNRGFGDVSSWAVGPMTCVTLVCNAASNYVRVFINGVKGGADGDITSYTQTASWDAGYYLGGGSGAASLDANKFKGVIYEMRIYNTALSDADVLSYSTAALSGYRTNNRILPML